MELFFKWITQHLRIKQFRGTPENAVKARIRIAVPVTVLVAIVEKRLDLDASPDTSPQIPPVAPFEKMPLHQSVTPGETKSDNLPASNQLNLFAY